MTDIDERGLAEACFAWGQEIMELRAEIERLRAALTAEPPADAGNIFVRGWRAAQAAARGALEGK